MKVIASFATFPPRYNIAVRAMQHLAPQVDILKVYVNDIVDGKQHRPPWLSRTPKNCEVTLGGDVRGNLGDAGKFYAAPTQGIHLTCDDDILYPGDYVETIVAGLQRHDGEYVVGFHGCDIAPLPVDSYYRGGQVNKCHFRRALPGDRPVHVLGTGVMAYMPERVRFPISTFRIQNMADIWCALRCQAEHVGMMCLQHPDGWLEASATPDEGIYHTYRDRDAAQTYLVNAVPQWNHYATAPEPHPG